MSIKLTEGALQIIMDGGDVNEPTMQILGSKKIQGSAANERYRLLISDGRYTHSFAMLATQLNEMYLRGELCDFTVIKIDRFITSVLNNTGRGEKRVLIILGVTVVTRGSELGMRIGNPQAWPEGGIPAASAPAPAPPTPQPVRIVTPSAPTVQDHGTLSSHAVHPITGLSPYQNKWVIKARIMSKSNIRTWSNSRGEGKLFSMDLCDETGEIRATAFKDQCDKYYDMIEVDKVYYISRCTLKTANKQYTTLKNDYEMTFDNNTVVEECKDTSSVPTVQYNFVPISDLSTKEPNAVVDIIGVCKNASDLQQLTARSTGRELKKREVTIMDPSGSAVAITLWGTDAETFDGSQQPVVAIRGGFISEYNGSKSISMKSGTILRVNPNMVEAHKLKSWFDNGGNTQDAVNMSARTGGAGGSMSNDWITFSEAEEKQLGAGEKGDYYNLFGHLTYVNSDTALYKACPQEQCNKKVVDQENGLYRCEKCNREYPNYKYRIIMSGYASDCTGEQWVTIFNEVAEAMLGKKVDEVGQALETDKKAYTSMIDDVTFKSFVFRIRTKLENYSDESKLKSTVMSATPINYKEANARLIKGIKSSSGIEIN